MAISSSPDALPSAQELLEPTPGAILRKRMFGDWGLMIGGGVLLFIVVVALIAPVLTWHDPLDQNLYNKNVLPVWH
jgi:peptide/nickel transport system permease protein